MGSVQTDRRHYEVHPLPPEMGERQRRSTDLVHALVTWTDLEEARDSQGDLSRHERSVHEQNYWGNDGLVLPHEEEEEEEEEALHKRSVEEDSEEEDDDEPIFGEEKMRKRPPLRSICLTTTLIMSSLVE